jgi:hypothetical protein
LRSDPKERRETRFFAAIGFPHTDDVTPSVTRRIDDLHKPASQQAETNDSRLSIVFARVLRFGCDSIENLSGIREIEPSLFQRGNSLGRIEGNAHELV